MIPENFIEQWRQHVKWQTPAQVEQDLIISRALTDLYNDPHVSEALVFRGGTALNKLFLKPPSRYSEDIDFVQKNADPIGQTIDAIRAVLNPWLGDPKWKITQRSAKLIYKYEAINKLPAKLKIEINTTEHFQVLPLRSEEFNVNSDWWSGNAKIATYEIDELMATKLRALYQRRKGRDLFDLWYVTKNELINLDRVFEIFTKYCANDDSHFTKDEFIKNLELKRDHQAFQSDMHALLPTGLKWNFDEAYQFVLDNVISRLP
ncbi:MAG TPA: nucleotidyl transferase AbiEii/AbiGii toxin family protein [Candidatus Megaira endosymbiont of Nemacystus decipiens]|nr:nucleotidyl transferase AbiEii/AbiGii toxin family protein [Candidatus Megaera endosymbiont of Nemacystus decipiens]